MTTPYQCRQTYALSLAAAFLAFAAGGFVAGPGYAQVIRGVVVDSTTNAPVAGVLVSLIAEGHRDLQRAIVDADGTFRFVLPGPGAYLIRSERIGVATTTVGGLAVGPGDTIAVRILLDTEPVPLVGITAGGTGRCELRGDLGGATHRVWEEARKSLEAVSYTDSADWYLFDLEQHVRELEPRSLRIRGETRSRNRSVSRRPIRSRPIDLLLSDGWVISDPKGDRYFAPDAHTLLSNEFLEAHCLRLAPRDEARHRLLALEFRPIRVRTGRTAIEGELWLSRETGALEWLDFRYRSLPGLAEEHRSDRIGGRVDFRSLPDGSWIVSEWRIRMPLMVEERDGLFGATRVRMTGIVEEGGRVVRATRRGTGLVAYSGHGGAIAGQVLGRADGRIRLVGIGTTAEVGEQGHFRFPNLPEGHYQLSYLHPSLAGIDRDFVVASARVAANDTAWVRLKPPRQADVLTRACGVEEWSADMGVLLGDVSGANAGAVAHVPVVASWTTAQDRGGRPGAEERTMATTTNALGAFQLCAVPADRRTLTVTAGSGRASASLDVRLSAEEPVRWVSVGLRR